MINDWGLPIAGHEYLTFYQMMLRISTGWSQPWLYWTVWQAMLLIREHLWCYLTDNCISSTAPQLHSALWLHHRHHRAQRLEFSINNDRGSTARLDQCPATLHWLFKNHSQIFWNNLMPTIFLLNDSKSFVKFYFWRQFARQPRDGWYITACTCSPRHNFLHKIFSSFNSNIFCLLLNI